MAINYITEEPLMTWLLRTRGGFAIYSSEMMLSYAADKFGAFFSIPPLIYQCTSKISSVQHIQKASLDNVGRWNQKWKMSEILKQGGEEELPEWLLECGFQ